MTWLRPTGPPKVWDKFTITKSDGEKFSFIIQEIPEDRYDEAVKHMCSIFVKDETLCSSLNIIDDPESLKILHDFWKKIIAEGITIAAFIESKNEKPLMAGINVLSVYDKQNDKKISPFVSTMSKADKMITLTINCSVEGNPCERYGADAYLGAVGLSVHPRFRRLGLGQRLLEARNKIGQVYGVSVTSTFFTSLAAQAAAAKAGFKVYSEKSYDKIVDNNGELVFPNLKGKGYKIMEKKLF